MRQLVQVTEWDRVRLPAEVDNPRMRRLIQTRAVTPFGDALVNRGRHLYAQGLAGMIDAGPVQIQIVPKIYWDSTTSEDAAVLLELFLLTARMRGVTIVPAATEAYRAPILEAVIQHVAATLERQLRAEGVPRRYAVQSEVGSTLRGRIDLAKVARRGPAQAHRLPITHHPLQGDNDLTRLLRSLALALAARSTIARSKAALYRCAGMLDEARTEPLTPALVSRVRPSRLEAHWSPFVELAELLTLGMAPNPIRPGDEGSVGLLFPLERLFENALREAMRMAVRGGAMRLSEQGRRLRLFAAPNDREIFPLKPDLVLNEAVTGRAGVVGDAKWKRLLSTRSNLGVTVADAYQILAYMRRYSVRRGALFFPSAVPLADTWRRTTWSELGDDDHIVEIVEVDVVRVLGATKRHGTEALADVSRLIAELSATERGSSREVIE